ncbi:MAG TPA: YetF domain-containing protein [Acidimicrobiales bacterium]
MEIVIRATVLFAVIWIVTRGLRRRALAELSPFEMILLVVIGDIVQQGITQEDNSVTGAITVLATFATLISVFTWVSWRFPRAERVLEGLPVVVVADGKVVEHALRLEQVPMSDLMSAARQSGVDTLEKIKLAVLEPSGKFSIITKE